jgi:hypothetical protein
VVGEVEDPEDELHRIGGRLRADAGALAVDEELDAPGPPVDGVAVRCATSIANRCAENSSVRAGSRNSWMPDPTAQ